MGINEESWLKLVDAFSGAAIGVGTWQEALAGLTDLVGGRAAQIIGLGSANSVPFNITHALPDEYAEHFAAIGGADPDVNPIMQVGTSIAPLCVRNSAEFISSDVRRSSGFLQEHERQFDIYGICLSPLVRDADMMVGMAVLSSAKQGDFNREQQQLFASLVAHARAAVLTQRALEHQGALLVAGTLEAMSMAVFVCDALACVRSLTPKAEAFLSDNNCLMLRRNQLVLPDTRETRRLHDSIRKAAHDPEPGGPPATHRLLLHDRNYQPFVVEIVSVPKSAHILGAAKPVLVVVRSNIRSDSARQFLHDRYCLTQAEAAVAIKVADGFSPEQIAQQRQTSVATVRKQLRIIYEKLGVHRQSELAALISQLR